MAREQRLTFRPRDPARTGWRSRTSPPRGAPVVSRSRDVTPQHRTSSVGAELGQVRRRSESRRSPFSRHDLASPRLASPRARANGDEPGGSGGRRPPARRRSHNARLASPAPGKRTRRSALLFRPAQQPCHFTDRFTRGHSPLVSRAHFASCSGFSRRVVHPPASALSFTNWTFNRLTDSPLRVERAESSREKEKRAGVNDRSAPISKS